jgi:predicted methyltransferase
MDKVRNWSKVLDNLRDSGYIKLDSKDDYLLLFTTKGKDYIQDMLVEDPEKENKKFNHVWVLKK